MDLVRESDSLWIGLYPRVSPRVSPRLIGFSGVSWVNPVIISSLLVANPSLPAHARVTAIPQMQITVIKKRLIFIFPLLIFFNPNLFIVGIKNFSTSLKNSG